MRDTESRDTQLVKESKDELRKLTEFCNTIQGCRKQI